MTLNSQQMLYRKPSKEEIMAARDSIKLAFRPNHPLESLTDIELCTLYFQIVNELGSRGLPNSLGALYSIRKRYQVD